MNYHIDQKRQLSELLGKFLTQFGRVLPRKPYREDDSGEGTAGLDIKSHPLLMNQPEGASSDLTANANQNKAARDEAEAKMDKLDPELRKQLQNQLLAEQKYQAQAKAAPSPGMN